jgi:hypothetical protein
MAGGTTCTEPGLHSQLLTCWLLCREARNHGISSVGLPSRLATFKALPQLEGGDKKRQQRPSSALSWWDLTTKRGGSSGGRSGSGGAAGSPTAAIELRNSEPAGRRHGRGLAAPVCCIEVPRVAPAWAPKIRMFLPSFRSAPPCLAMCTCLSCARCLSLAGAHLLRCLPMRLPPAAAAPPPTSPASSSIRSS